MPRRVVGLPPIMMSPIPILLYHRVDRSGGPFATDPDGFARHLSWLADRGYRSLTTAELDAALADRVDPGRGRFVLTFDDGFADLDTTVAPLLRHHGFSATAFVITSQVPDHPVEGGEHLAWSSAKALVDEGLLEVHSHSHDHLRRPTAPSAETDAEVRDDLATSIEILSDRLGQRPARFTHLAWPFGHTTPAWEQVAADLGLTTQYVVQRGAVTHQGRHQRLPRLMADDYPLTAVKGWMRTLSNPVGARATNRVFGTIRQRRRGCGYV